MTSVEVKEAAKSESAPRVMIAVRNLDFYYGKFQALKQIALDFYANQATALIGPSGCGKSTFLRTLNRMNDLIPDTRSEGSIRFDGIEILRNARRRSWFESLLPPAPNREDVSDILLRKRIGMVFQRPNPFPMSIKDNILYGPRTHGERDRKKLDALVEWCLQQAALWDEVKDLLNKSALDLSGGQQQRLCIARALAVGPDVLLMDEPCSALDPNSTARVEDLIQKLKADYTIVIVTHNMQQAARVSERAAFFLKGEMVECNETSVIFRSPRDKRTEDYVQGRFG